MTAPESSVLKRLESEQLSAVVFVMDYVQFQFGGPVLTAYVWPIVRDSANTFSHGTLGYRDALCSLIGNSVAETSEIPGERLRVHFVNGVTLEVSLKECDRDGPDAAMFRDPRDRLWDVW